MASHWNERLAIGVPEIDAQHQELFERVERFEESLRRREAPDVTSTFEFLRSYAAVHFASEERLMRETRYPDLEAHVAEHREYVARLDALVRDHEARGPVAFAGLKARNWILVWLLDHVAGRDQALGKHLRAASGVAGTGRGR